MSDGKPGNRRSGRLRYRSCRLAKQDDLKSDLGARLCFEAVALSDNEGVEEPSRHFQGRLRRLTEFDRVYFDRIFTGGALNRSSNFPVRVLGTISAVFPSF